MDGMTDIDNLNAQNDKLNIYAHVDSLITENKLRNERLFAYFNPITGEGSIGERKQIFIPDFVIPNSGFR